MAMSASLQIVNQTGSAILFTNVDQVNDDATWSVEPPAGVPIPNGGNCLIAMGNSSIFVAPRGVGANCIFVCQGNFQAGQINFDDPAVGAHSFGFGNTKAFKYETENPTGNSYIVTIALA